MTKEEERFMAFEGVLQWAQAVVQEGERLEALYDSSAILNPDFKVRHERTLALHTECHFFVIAADKFIAYRDWARRFGLFAMIDFTEIDALAEHVTDLRNMREHVIDYFQGGGHTPDRWRHQSADGTADASSLQGTKIGGRLDWKEFAAAVQRVLPQLWAEPIPFPSQR
jgi:hypothetical protein